MTDTGLPRTTFRGFLFADLRGYSDYVERHGDLSGVELLERYRQLVRSTISRYNGAEIRTEGDSFYVVFPSASSAVSCAVEIVAASASSEPKIPVGIGIHAGEAADTGEGPVGSAVNIAARVCSRAAAGEVLVTETVRAVTRTVLPYRYVPRGTPTLKGITEPIPLFSVISADASSTAATPRRWSAGVRSGALLGLMLVFGILLIGLIATSLNLFGASLVTPTPAAPTIQPGQTAAPPSPSPSATAAAAASTPPATLVPTEAELLARFTGLTAQELATCRSATVDERSADATTSVTCDFAAGGDASQLLLEEFDEPARMLTAFSLLVTAHSGSGGDCSTSGSGYSPWNVPHVSQGHVLCYPSAGDSYIIWTHEGGQGAGIMGSAIRHDMLWAPLYDWWQEFHSLITH